MATAKDSSAWGQLRRRTPMLPSTIQARQPANQIQANLRMHIGRGWATVGPLKSRFIHRMTFSCHHNTSNLPLIRYSILGYPDHTTRFTRIVSKLEVGR